MPGFWLSAQGQLELAIKTNAEAQMATRDVDPKVLDFYVKSREAQIEAVRNYLFVLQSGGAAPSAPAAAAPPPAAPAHPGGPGR